METNTAQKTKCLLSVAPGLSTTASIISKSDNPLLTLQPDLQRVGKLTSLSWIDTTSGPPHTPTWTSICRIDGEEVARGEGTHKHLARDAAADIALQVRAGEE